MKHYAVAPIHTSRVVTVDLIGFSAACFEASLYAERRGLVEAKANGSAFALLSLSYHHAGPATPTWSS
jgi:hypothetical protein